MDSNRNCVIGDHFANYQRGNVSNRKRDVERQSPRRSKETLSRQTTALNINESFSKEISFVNRKPGVADPRFWRKCNMYGQGEHLRNSGSKYIITEKKGKLNLINNVQQNDATKRTSKLGSVCSDKASQTKKMEPVEKHFKNLFRPNFKSTPDSDENVRRTKNMYTLSRSQSCSTFDHRHFLEENCDFEHTTVNNSERVNAAEAERTTRWVDQTIFIKSLSPSVLSLNSDVPVKLEQDMKPILVEERYKTTYLGKANSVVTVVGARPELFISHRILPGSLNKNNAKLENNADINTVHYDHSQGELKVEISGTDMTPSLSPSEDVSKFSIRNSQKTLSSLRDVIKKKMTPTWKCSSRTGETIENEKYCSKHDCLLCQLASTSLEGKTTRGNQAKLRRLVPLRWLPWRSVFWLTMGGVTFWVTSNIGGVLLNVIYPPEDDSVIESVFESIFDFFYRITLRPQKCRSERWTFLQKK